MNSLNQTFSWNERPAGAGVRRVSTHEYEVRATPEAAFALLCPVREYDWIDGWTATVIHSETGVAERDCVFTTAYLGALSEWVCCQYEPPQRIGYVAVASGLFTMRLEIRLTPTADGVRLHWTRIFTSLGAEGAAALSAWPEDREAFLEEQFRAYIERGELLRDPARH